MKVKLENSFLKISLVDKGAELKSVIRKDSNQEYMWSGDPSIWGKTSPILFPIVGTLKNNTYTFNNISYQLARHGFARDCVFEIETQAEDRAVFLLKSNPETFENYPFHFELRVTYSIEKDILRVDYQIKNTGANEMYFSIGGHPAFKVPLTDQTSYDDYYLQFEHTENALRWPIDAGGLIENKAEPFFNNSSRIDISHELFKKDALVFKGLASRRVSLKSNAHNHGLDFNFEEFPFLGLWAAKGGNFVCIEPWCGIADSVSHNGELIHKEGIEQLSGGSNWSRAWSVRCF